MLAEGGFRRRKLSMTPLIDVIFLLLLFFMLTSTFSKFGEIELTQAAPGAGGSATTKPWFLQLSEEGLRLNGREVGLEGIAETMETGNILISLDPATSSQRLVDLLAVLRRIPEVSVTVLE